MFLLKNFISSVVLVAKVVAGIAPMDLKEMKLLQKNSLLNLFSVLYLRFPKELCCK
jgi:hypothetical protein